MFKFIVKRRMWTYDGHIVINECHLGINVPYDNRYYMMDVGDVDPVYRLYLMGYALCSDGKIRKKYRQSNGFRETLRVILNGRCACCMKLCGAELCPVCAEEFGRCSVVEKT